MIKFTKKLNISLEIDVQILYISVRRPAQPKGCFFFKAGQVD